MTAAGDPELDKLFEDRLRAVCGEKDLRRVIAAAGLDPDRVTAAVASRKPDILGAVAFQVDAWQKARVAVDEAGRAPAVRWGLRRRGVAIAALVTVVAITICTLIWGRAGAQDSGVLSLAVVALALTAAVYQWVTVLAMRRVTVVPLRRRERNGARDRLEDVLESQLTVHARQAINQQIPAPYTTRLREPYDAGGLKGAELPGREVSTDATLQLQRLMASLEEGASIGLAGPRGSGKTTLMHSAALGASVLPQDRQRQGLHVSAPLRYDPREFVLHVFGKLCETVLGPEHMEDVRYLAAQRRRFVRLRAGLLVAAIACAATGIALALWDTLASIGKTQASHWAFLAATVLGALWLRITPAAPSTQMALERAVLKLRPTSLDPEVVASLSDKRSSVDRHARVHLEEIQFQQSVSTGFSAGVDLPWGAKLATDDKVSLTRAPMTLPEVVDRFRAFAQEVTERDYLVIGIDELDKMGSEQDARDFLNAIKSIFGVRRCFFLVSVSEDAMSSFERRGLPFRDVFDSSFDAIQRVGYLTLAESRSVLERRVVGLGIPYQCLCHVLAGGLARDLIRVARELLHHSSVHNLNTLSSLTYALVESELRAKSAAAILSARREPEADEREWLLGWLLRQDGFGPGAALLGRPKAKRTRPLPRHPHRGRRVRSAQAGRSARRRLRRRRQLVAELWSRIGERRATTVFDTPPSTAGSGEGERDDASRRGHARAIANEVATLYYYAATVLEFFDDQLREDVLEDALRGKDPYLERLARARQDFTLGPSIAWGQIDAFRSAAGLLPLWQRPTTAR